MVGPHLLKGIWANGNHNKAMNVKGYNFLAKLPAIFTFIRYIKFVFLLQYRYCRGIRSEYHREVESRALVTQIISLPSQLGTVS